MLVAHLAAENLPIVKDTSATDQLNDPEKYVVTGIETDIVTNHKGTSYICKAGLFRTFSELDLKEVRRLKSVKSINKQKELLVDY